MTCYGYEITKFESEFCHVILRFMYEDIADVQYFVQVRHQDVSNVYPFAWQDIRLQDPSKHSHEALSSTAQG